MEVDLRLYIYSEVPLPFIYIYFKLFKVLLFEFIFFFWFFFQSFFQFFFSIFYLVILLFIYFLFFKVIFFKFKCFIILYTYFKKLNKIKYIIFFYIRKSTFVMFFDFRKSTSGDDFWLLEVDFRWWFLTSRSRLPVMIFDFRKSYILTSGSRHPEVFLGVWCPCIFLNGQRVFWEFKDFLEVQKKCLEV